jgi:hypothetical protein
VHTTTIGSNGAEASLPVRLIALVPSNIACWHPLLTSSRLDAEIAVHHIHVLERERLRFEEEEVYDARSYEVAAEENKSEGVAYAVVSIWGQEPNHEVA